MQAQPLALFAHWRVADEAQVKLTHPAIQLCLMNGRFQRLISSSLMTALLAKVVVNDEYELQSVVDRFVSFASTDTSIIQSSTVVHRLPKFQHVRHRTITIISTN